MDLQTNHVSIVLGDEYDQSLRSDLGEVLRSYCGADRMSEWGVLGSQELEIFTIKVEGSEVILESETYVGLTLSGPETLVLDIQRQVEAKKLLRESLRPPKTSC